MTSILQKKNRLNFPTDSVSSRDWDLSSWSAAEHDSIWLEGTSPPSTSPRRESYNASKKVIKSENQTIVSIVGWGKKQLTMNTKQQKKTILLKEGFQFHSTVKNIGEKMLTSSE